MFYLILAGVLALVLVGGILFALFAGEYDRAGGVGTAIVAFLLLVAVTIGFSVTTVGARAVGIETAFGRYERTLSNGFHFKAPWASVEEFSTQIQPLDRENLPVGYEGGGNGDVDVTVRWTIDPEAAENLWKKYRTFDNVRDQLVSSTVNDSLRAVLGQYTPNEAKAGENLRPITQAVVNDLTTNLADDGIEIDSVSIKNIALDDATQRSISKTVTAAQDVERAKQEQERAKIDAETARIREQSGSLSRQSLVRYCLEVTNSWDVSKNGPLPATWNCLGNSTDVLVNSGR